MPWTTSAFALFLPRSKTGTSMTTTRYSTVTGTMERSPTWRRNGAKTVGLVTIFSTEQIPLRYFVVLLCQRTSLWRITMSEIFWKEERACRKKWRFDFQFWFFGMNKITKNGFFKQIVLLNLYHRNSLPFCLNFLYIKPYGVVLKCKHFQMWTATSIKTIYWFKCFILYHVYIYIYIYI